MRKFLSLVLVIVALVCVALPAADVNKLQAISSLTLYGYLDEAFFVEVTPVFDAQMMKSDNENILGENSPGKVIGHWAYFVNRESDTIAPRVRIEATPLVLNGTAGNPSLDYLVDIQKPGGGELQLRSENSNPASVNIPINLASGVNFSAEDDLAITFHLIDGDSSSIQSGFYEGSMIFSLYAD